MGFSVMLWGAEKLVPAEYWCPNGMLFKFINLREEEKKLYYLLYIVNVSNLHMWCVCVCVCVCMSNKYTKGYK